MATLGAKMNKIKRKKRRGLLSTDAAMAHATALLFSKKKTPAQIERAKAARKKRGLL